MTNEVTPIKKQEVWLVRVETRNSYHEVLSVWSSRALAMQQAQAAIKDAEFTVKADADVLWIVETATHVVTVQKQLVMDTWGYLPSERHL